MLSDIPDDVMINDGNENGNDLLSSLDQPFNSNIPSNDGLLQQNGPTSLQTSLSKGGTGNVGSDKINVSKSIGMRSPRPNMATGLAQNCPPQGPISTSGMPTPPTPMLNTMRSVQSSIGNMQANNPMSHVTSSMVNTGTFNSNPMHNAMMPNSNSNSIFNGQMSMSNPMNVMGQNMHMMSRGQNFNANPGGFGNNMPMMPNRNMYGNPGMNIGYRMNMNQKVPNMGNFNSLMNPMMESSQEALMLGGNVQNATGMPMQRMVRTYF